MAWTHFFIPTLKPKALALLVQIIEDRKLFDKHDNCLQASTREIAERLALSSKTTVIRLLDRLKAAGYLREVRDISNQTRLMLSPDAVWLYRRTEKPFAAAMFTLGSHKSAVEWRNVCVILGRYVDASTGEVLGKYPNKLMHEYRNGYRLDDRTKRRASAKRQECVNEDGILVSKVPLSNEDLDAIIQDCIITQELLASNEDLDGTISDPRAKAA